MGGGVAAGAVEMYPVTLCASREGTAVEVG